MKKEFNVLSDSEQKKVLPSITTYHSSIFTIDLENIEERTTQYGDHVFVIDDFFLDFENIRNLTKKLPYTYDKLDLNNAAYLYRSPIHIEKTIAEQFKKVLSDLFQTDMEICPREALDLKINVNNILNSKPDLPLFLNSTFSYFTKDWYDLHFNMIDPHQDGDGMMGVDPRNKILSTEREQPYVIIVYINDGPGTSLYTYKKNKKEMEHYHKSKNFSFVSSEHELSFHEFYQEILTVEGKPNRMLLYPANCPHKVSDYKQGIDYSEFEKEGRFYFMLTHIFKR